MYRVLHETAVLCPGRFVQVAHGLLVKLVTCEGDTDEDAVYHIHISNHSQSLC